MLVNVTPSGKAPPGRLRSGVGAMALVTALPVAARGSHADNSAGFGRTGAAGAEVEGGRGVGGYRSAPGNDEGSN
jgi:hypothetical protein